MSTIRDISKYVGVSISTVSRALNSSGYVSSDVKKKVIAAAELLEYIPNETARSLNTNKSKIIGVLVPDITNPFFPKIIRGIEDAAIAEDYRIIIGNTDHDIEKEKKYVEIFHQNNCVGIISATWSIKRLGIISKIPIVLLDRVVDNSISIQADHFKGGMIQAEHLIIKGAENILLIQGSDTYSSFIERFKGALSILKDSNIAFSIYNYNDIEHDLKNNDIDKIKNHDGFICPNDLLAYKLLKTLIENDIEVPREAKVIGYDNLEFSNYVHPPLTTISQPAYELGVAALETLLKISDRKEVENMKLDVLLIRRNST